MRDTNQKQLGNTRRRFGDQLTRGMNTDDVRDYMASFLFLRYLSDNHEATAKKESEHDYPQTATTGEVSRAIWCMDTVGDVAEPEQQMVRTVRNGVQPDHRKTSMVVCHTWRDDMMTSQTQDHAALGTNHGAVMQQLFPSPEVP
jgi:type I restriction enzyme M protein